MSLDGCGEQVGQPYHRDSSLHSLPNIEGPVHVGSGGGGGGAITRIIIRFSKKSRIKKRLMFHVV